MPSENPFVYSRVLAPDEVVDREPEVERLLALALGGHYVRLVAPRRYGKTSLMGKLFALARDRHGIPGILVDLWGVDSLADLTVRIERAYAAQLEGGLRRRIEAHLRTLNLGLSIGTQGISVTLQQRPAQFDPLPALHALLELPRAVLGPDGRRTLIVFDEFQAIANVARADETLRSHIQHHGAFASYVFSGSMPGMMRLLFGSRVRPLFGQAENEELGPLRDEDAGSYIERRFAAVGRDVTPTLSALLALAAGHPQRLMLLAHRLFDETPRGARADEEAWQRALTETMRRLDGEFTATWEGYSAPERRTLRAIAQHGSPYSRAAQAANDLDRGAAERGLRKLRDGGDVAPDAYRIIDPLLAQWIRLRILRLAEPGPVPAS